MKLAKTVAGIYILDDGEVVASEEFSESEIPAKLEEKHELEEEYSGAEYTVLTTGELAEIAERSENEIHRLQTNAAETFTEKRLEEAGDRDQLLVQAVRALEDLDEINNELIERLRPWYAVHFPELVDEVSGAEELAAMIEDGAHRDEIEAGDGGSSTGIEITGKDAAMLERVAAQVSDSHQVREELESYVEELGREVAPNLSAVVGPVLAARLISLAGSLDELAKMPSSTVQVLGAEKAMFRHMRGEGDAPKHGVLFMHEYVRKVPGDETGKMARILANKASIAARIDNYNGDFRGDELSQEVERQYEEIRHG